MSENGAQFCALESFHVLSLQLVIRVYSLFSVLNPKTPQPPLMKVIVGGIGGNLHTGLS